MPIHVILEEEPANVPATGTPDSDADEEPAPPKDDTTT